MPTFNIALRYVPSCLQWILMVMEWFLPNTFSRKKPGVTMRGQLASTRACKMLPGSEKLCQDTTSDQPNILVSYFCLPEVARRVLSVVTARCPSHHLTVTAAESSPGQQCPAAAGAAGASSSRTTVGTRATVSPCDWGGGDSCTAQSVPVSPCLRVSVSPGGEGGEGGGPQ